MRPLVAALIALGLGCNDGSRLAAPEAGAPRTQGPVTITAVEVSGGQRSDLVGLYLSRAFRRAHRMCHPKPGTAAEVVVTISRTGYVAEVGLEPLSTALVCARPHIEKQRFPRVKRRTLASARVEFWE